MSSPTLELWISKHTHSTLTECVNDISQLPDRLTDYHKHMLQVFMNDKLIKLAVSMIQPHFN